MKKIFRNLLNFVKNLYKKLVDETKEYIPVAIDVVEGLKKVLDSQVDDIVLSVVGTLVPNLPTAQINIIKSKIEKALPKILLELNLVDSIANITDINEQLKSILETLKVSSDDIKAEKYHTIASKVLVVLGDGKITWGEAVMFTE